MQIRKHIPNTITSMNLLSGAVGVIFALEGRIDIAFPLMLASAVFDFCDGLAARALNAYSPIGKELDSLADMVSFGLLPALMLYRSMPEGRAAFLPLFIAVMSGIRLAKFNVDERQTLDFLGLPTPACALLCGSLAYFIQRPPDSFLAQWSATPYFIPALSLLLGLLLVSEIPMFGMKIKKGHKLLDAQRIVFLGFILFAVILTMIMKANWSLIPLLVFSFYILENLVCAAFRR